MMNEREILILQIKQWTGEWEDITRQVQWFDALKNACRIKYVGNATFYWKSYKDLIIYDKPVIVDTIGKIVYCDKVPVKGVYQIIVFNRGSKYFSDEEKASAYFDYMTACGFEAELWLVRRYYDEQGTLVKGEQVLWESESDDGIISLLN